MSRPLPQMITLHPVGQICISLEISSRMKKGIVKQTKKKKTEENNRESRV